MLAIVDIVQMLKNELPISTIEQTCTFALFLKSTRHHTDASAAELHNILRAGRGLLLASPPYPQGHSLDFKCTCLSSLSQ